MFHLKQSQSPSTKNDSSDFVHGMNLWRWDANGNASLNQVSRSQNACVHAYAWVDGSVCSEQNQLEGEAYILLFHLPGR